MELVTDFNLVLVIPNVVVFSFRGDKLLLHRQMFFFAICSYLDSSNIFLVLLAGVTSRIPLPSNTLPAFFFIIDCMEDLY